MAGPATWGYGYGQLVATWGYGAGIKVCPLDATIAVAPTLGAQVSCDNSLSGSLVLAPALRADITGGSLLVAAVTVVDTIRGEVRFDQCP